MKATKDPKKKKAWKILGYFAGILFDLESIILGGGVFLSALIYQYNVAMKNEAVVIDSVPLMLSVIDGNTTMLIAGHLFLLGLAAYTRILSYFAKKRYILSIFANGLYLGVNVSLFIHLGQDKLTVFFVLLSILYLTNSIVTVIYQIKRKIKS